MFILLSHASRRGLVFMQVVRDIIIKGNFKVARLTHILVEWLGAPWGYQWLAQAPGESSVVLGDPGGPV